MKVFIVKQFELPHQATAIRSSICGVAVNDEQIVDLITKAIANRENSQRLEDWIHPTILFFSKEEREIGVYGNLTTEQVWTKEKGFL